MNDEGPPRFVVDVMLGRLARWLRALGYDTRYSASADDPALAALARLDDRILLTRDRELARRRGLRVVLLNADQLAEQRREVMRAIPLDTTRAFTRCLECNAMLEETGRQAARDLVPPYVYQTHTRFKRCPACGRVYWRGTHWAQMTGTLDEDFDTDLADPAGGAR